MFLLRVCSYFFKFFCNVVCNCKQSRCNAAYFLPLLPPLQNKCAHLFLATIFSSAPHQNHPSYMNTKCEIHRRPIEFQATTRIFLTSTFYHVSRGDKGSLFLSLSVSLLWGVPSRMQLSAEFTIAKNKRSSLFIADVQDQAERGRAGCCLLGWEGCGRVGWRLWVPWTLLGKVREEIPISVLTFSFLNSKRITFSGHC